MMMPMASKKVKVTDYTEKIFTFFFFFWLFLIPKKCFLYLLAKCPFSAFHSSFLTFFQKARTSHLSY